MDLAKCEILNSSCFLIASLRIRFIALILVVLLMYVCIAEDVFAAPNLAEKNLTVGALLPLHGDSYNHGISAQIALGMAEADINKLFSDMGRTIGVNVVVKDTQTDPEVTLKALKELQAEGIKIIIGPEDSQSLSYVREYANQSGIILISCTSTAPSLAIKNDTTFRLVPDDISLAHLLAAIIHKNGTKVLIPLARKDVWADNILSATKSEFESMGGIMLEAVRYDPQTTNFSSELDLLRSDVRSAVKDYGECSVAVYVSAFDEVVQILSQSTDDPILSSIRWYGNDLSEVAIARDQNASRFAVSTRFFSPICGGGDRPEYKRINRAVLDKTGYEASPLAVNDYDALWLIIHTYLITGSDDPKAVQQVLPLVAKTYRGEFGWMALNEAGDLKEVPFTLAYLTEDNGTFMWTPYAIL